MMYPTPCLSLRICSRLPSHQYERTVPSLFQKSLGAAYYRGGTSRAVIIQPKRLPKNRALWPSIFRQIIGSGDPYGRQLDGMGAGVSSLSKICLVEPYEKKLATLRYDPKSEARFIGFDPARETTLTTEEAKADSQEPEIDIDYTFVGLGIENNEVDTAGHCGNMSSAIGPYAYNAGLLPHEVYAKGDGSVVVKIRNTNTGMLLEAKFEVLDGQAATLGEQSVDGVSGTGSPIALNFLDPYGSKTGRVLPTGNKIDNIEGYEVSCVDGINPVVFIRADNVGVLGTILPDDLNQMPDKLALLEQIRKKSAVAMGIATTEESVSLTIPKIGLVSPPAEHLTLSGQTLKVSQVDIIVRFLSDTRPHRAVPLTAAVTTAVAARTPGTIVEQMIALEPATKGVITIGHASGRIEVDATMDPQNESVPISATVVRTAKRLFEGKVFWIDKGQESIEGSASYGEGGRHSRGMAFVLESRGQSSSHLFKGDHSEEDAASKQSWKGYSDGVYSRKISFRPNSNYIKSIYPHVRRTEDSAVAPRLLYVSKTFKKRRDITESTKNSGQSSEDH